MTGTDNYWLVLLSVIVATMASFVALDLSGRVSYSHTRLARRLWLTAGGLVCGSGIWTMHFIGMLGFRLPVAVSYDVLITLGSLALAIAGSSASLALTRPDRLRPTSLLFGGVMIGAAISAMHYTGMSALRLVPPIQYNAWLVALSVLIGMSASVLALWSARRLRSRSFFSAVGQKAGSAVFLGSAIYGMHYTGMAAARFEPGAVSSVHPQHLFNPNTLAVVLGGVSLVLLLSMLLVSSYDVLRASVAQAHAETLGKAVEQTEGQVRKLSRRLIEAQDAERRRLATELHDIVGQNLSALATELALVRNRLPSAPPELLRSVETATTLARQSIESIRKVMVELRPPGLDELGLAAALRWYARAFQSRTSIPTRVDADESLPKPSPVVADAILRIFLETLTNVSKHADAQEVRVDLHRQGNDIVLRVSDDGRGFDRGPPVLNERSGWGLTIMRERAAAIGATYRIHSSPGNGTEVELSISEDAWS
jgi:NO-binding membrane sensor protein with MHYT domain/two-component sensor histidine kinase